MIDLGSVSGPLDAALTQLASTGIVGAVFVIALVALRAKDRQLNDEKAARIEDAKDMMTLAMDLQKQVIFAVNKLSDMTEAAEKRENERERTGRRS